MPAKIKHNCCVECYQDNQCFFGQVCDTTNGNLCRNRCFGNFCQGGDVCDPSVGLCVDCLSNSDCDNGEICNSANRRCVECISNADCSSSANQPVCLASRNECVECVSNADCNAPETCDVNNECRVPTNRPICDPCTQDSQCGGANDLCITGNDQACAQDCSNTPCPRGYECVDARNNTARQCRPSYEMSSPTCTAVRNLGIDCPYSVRDRDPGCGIRNIQDARCVRDSSTPLGGVCIVWCQTDDQCPIGFSCVQQPGLTFGYCL